MNKTCIVCSSSQNSVIFQEFGIDILRCANCGHVFSSYQAVENYTGYWGPDLAETQEQFWWDQAHKEMYDDFCRRFIVGKKGRLLDVGCGLGYFVKTLSGFPTWEVSGYEISQSAVNFARGRLGLRNIHCGRVEESNLERNSFDIITLWDVIEHIPQPDSLLSHLAALLTKDGTLFLHTPNIEFQLPKARLKKLLRGMAPRSHYLEARDHVNIYSMRTLRMVLGRNGLPDVRYIHFRPIQSVAGSRSQLLRLAKNLWVKFSASLFWLSFGRINLDNLFAIARKGSA